nr:insulinase family protein [Pseudopedobacter sp.]
MKKILSFAIASFICYQASAQITIDRTKQPTPGPAPIITIPDPVSYKLANGITLLVVEDHKLPKVSASLFIDAGPITEGKKAGVMSMMGQMLNEGTTTMSKAEFDEAVDRIGADVSLSSSGGNASSLTRYFTEAFKLMADGLKNPSMPQESFDKLKSQTITGIKSDAKNVKAVSGRVISALSYGINHPNGEFVTEESINNLTLADVKTAYSKYITPSRTYLTIIGDIKPVDAKKLAESLLGNWKGSPLTLPILAKVSNPAKTEIDVVDMSNAVQSEITVTNLVDLKLSDPDYFAVLLANQILGGGSESRLFNNLREKHGFTYGAYSNTGAGRYQSTFSASASVRSAKTDSAVVEFINEIESLRNTKVSDEELATAKALYNGSFALGMENTSRIATFARNILINELPKDFYRTYLQKINAVNKEDIQRVAQKYFNAKNTRIIVVGNTSQMLDGLKKLSYPVMMYDKFAEAVKESTSSVNVTAPEIFKAYVTVMGGEAELQKVKSIKATMTMGMQGMSLNASLKTMSPNMELMEVTMNGNTVMKSVFNGSTGYQAQMGNKKDMTAEEIKEKSAITSLFEQLDYFKNPAFKSEVKGVEKVNGSDAYKVMVTYPTGKVKTEYYDVKSKFLLRTEEVTGLVNNTNDYSDYRKVGNIMYPYALTTIVSAGGQQQVIEMKVTDLKLNSEVSAEDFK